MKKIDGASISDVYALTPMQEGMLFHYLKEPASGLYIEQLVLYIDGRLDIPALLNAWQRVTRVNECLRTLFDWEKTGEPLQLVLKNHTPRIDSFDWSGETARLDALKKEDRSKVTDLGTVPFKVSICRLAPERFVMIVTSHHILYDGWSNGVILRELFQCYNTLKNNVPPGQETLKTPYKAYVKKLQEKNREKDGGELYWTGVLDREPDGRLPLKRGNSQTAAGTRGHRIQFDDSLVEKVDRLSRDGKVTAASLLYAAWGLLLRRLKNSGDVIFGITVSGRSFPLPRIEEMVGLFINTVPLRVSDCDNLSAAGYLEKLAMDLNDLKPFQHHSLAQINELAGIHARRDLFDSLLVVENYPLDQSLLPMDSGLTIRSFEMVEQTHYDLTVIATLFDGIEITFLYDTDVLEDSAVQMLARYLRRVVLQLASTDQVLTQDIQLLSEEEKQRILSDFNSTETSFPRDKTIHGIFREQVERSPDRAAILVTDNAARIDTHLIGSPRRGALSRGDSGVEADGDSYLSYAELNRRVEKLAFQLREDGLVPGMIVAVKMRRSVDMVIAILGILSAGAAYLPIDPDYPQERIDYILKDSNTKLVVGDRLSVSGEPESVEFLTPTPDPRQPAYIIYTSGSTGKPKGVVVEHGSVVNLLYAMQQAYPLRENDVYLFKTSYLFDVSVTELFGWYMDGGALAVLAAGAEKDPVLIIDMIQRAGVTHINFVPSMFNAFVDVLDDEIINNLSSLRYIFLAGEALPASLVEKFTRFGLEVALENIYGPTEATVYAAWYSLSRWSAGKPVAIGKPLPNVTLFILDKKDRLQPIGGVGELCIGGTGLARGYLNRPELTADRFPPAQPGHRSYWSYRSYKTGDLARWMQNGDIEYLGRMDHQVKVRGFRIELGEIENALLSHPDVKEAAAVVRQDRNDENLIVAYVVLNSAPANDSQFLASYLSTKLPEYMIPSFFVELERLPLGSAGKIDRRALPLPESVDQPAYEPPRGEIETVLADIWPEVLAIDGDRLGVHHHFFKMGGHSLKATRLVARIYKRLQVRIPVEEVFKAPTIRSLAKRLEEYRRTDYVSPPVPPASEREYYPLTPAQNRLYLLQQRDLDSTSYNMPFCVMLEGRLDDKQVQRMQEAISALIRRHQMFRTSFVSLEGQPVQQIQDEVCFEIDSVGHIGHIGQIDQIDQIDPIKDMVRPFDLRRAPLLRVMLFKTGESRHMMFMDMHHIIADGASLEIFVREFAALYSGRHLPDQPVQYKDYVQWLNEPDSLRTQALERQREHWIEKFSRDLPVLELPLDFPRPAVLEYKGARSHFQLSSGDAHALETLASGADATMFMVLLSAYYIFLAKVSGQREMIVGIPGEGRGHDDLTNVIGMFVNTLALKCWAEDEQSFSQFLTRVKQATLTAFENQDYQYEDLVDAVAGERDLSRNPLFDAVFVLQELDISAIKLEGLTLKPYVSPVLIDAAKFDLTLTVQRMAGGLDCFFEYRTRLFKEETIRRFIQFFKRVVSSILNDPGTLISGIEIISEDEKQRILKEFNDTASDYPSESTIHELFEEQVVKTPGRIALIDSPHLGSPRRGALSRGDSGVGATGGSNEMSYWELNRRSDIMARELRENGLLPENIAAILAERTIETMIAILGTLKAGGIYMPIDPDYPEERIQYMLQDSGARLLITMEGLTNEPSPLERGIIGDGSIPARRGEPIGGNSNGAYIMYTSGSTGGPKGVLVEHRNVVRLVKNTNYVDFTPETRILQTGAPVFDATTFEMWGALLNGGQLILVEKTVILDAKQLGRAILDHHVNTLWLSSPLFNQLCREDFNIFSTLQYLLVGGDVLSPPMINLVRATSENLKIINGYGPTENTTFSTTFHIRRDYESSIPIGSPIANSTAFILNRDGGLQPIGVYGELWVGGHGVARGYLNNPELTSQRFVDRLYRTGDIVRWLEDGTIEFAGRVDDQVKIRGFRVECGEIETRLLAVEALREVVVLPLTDAHGEKYLCAYFTATMAMEPLELRDFLADELPAYMIPGYFIQLESMPLNPNGKINRKALPLPEEVSDAAAMAGEEAHTSEQSALIEIFAEVLARSANAIRLDDDFFQLGGHSLRAASLAGRIHKRFGVNIPLAEIFQFPTVRELAGKISGQTVDGGFDTIDRIEDLPYYPQSPAQKRLYVLQKFEEGGTGYNIPSLWELRGQLDKDRLEETFRQLIRRHESLRTSFGTTDDVPVQIIHDEVDFSMGPIGPIDPIDPIGPINDLVRPFDLSSPPLFRVSLFSEEEGGYLLFFDMHHIISDGRSMDLLVRDLMALYNGGQLLPLAVRYRDYTHWLSLDTQREVFNSQREFWQRQFSGEVPLLSLPLDYPRPPVQSFKGGQEHFRIDEASTRRLNRFAGKHGATLFMMLLTLYNILLSKLTGQDDMVVGTPVSGRPVPELDGVIGMFVNTLALRNVIDGNKSFGQLLNECKERSLSAFENQDLPFEELVESLDIKRDSGRNPLFDTMLSLQNMERSAIEIPGLIIEPRRLDSGISKFDLILQVAEEQGGLDVTLEYCIDLFKPGTARRMVRYFKTIVSSVIAEPSLPVGDIEIVSGEERDRLLHEFNDHRDRYPEDATLHGLFMDQAARTPDCVALSGICLCDGGDGTKTYQLTYRQVDDASTELARDLRRRGMGDERDQFVGLLAERSVEQVIAMLGILKSGCGYAPLNPKAPAPRSAYILNETRASLMITNCSPELAEAVETESDLDEVIHLTGLWPLGNSGSIAEPGETLPNPDPSRLAYVIFTSGSTGRPKGVPITHSNVVPLIFWHYANLPFELGDRSLQNLSYYFDWSVCDIFLTITCGAELHMVHSDVLLDPEASVAYMNRHRITTIHITPTQWQYLVVSRQKADTLKHLIIGAEKLTYDLVLRSFDLVAGDCRIYNMYGPTECSILTAGLIVNRDTFPSYKFLSSVPIGHPTANADFLILDKYGKLRPINVPGEMFISGNCLSRGYLNDPEKTLSAFVPNPFEQDGIRGPRMYRTGDLSRWLPNGEIEFLGRIDHQVKMRGYRIELGEIENRLLEHEAVKEAVLTAREDRDGDKYLCAYVVFRDPADPVTPTDLKQDLSRELPDYMIPSYFVPMPELPLNPNGKVDRKNLPEPQADSGASVYTAPATPVEQRLAEIWANVLDVDLERIGRESRFFDLGGHSLKATVMTSRVDKALGVNIPLNEIFKTPSLRGVAAFISDTAAAAYRAVTPVETREYYPVSAAQNQMYLLEGLGNAGTIYNLTDAGIIDGTLDFQRMDAAFQALIRRHESLRTSFHFIDGAPVQRVHDAVPFEIRNIIGPIDPIIADFIRPFDLSAAPLMRVLLAPLEQNKHLLLLDLHHIIYDGYSSGILMRDFFQLYRGEQPTPLTVQYKDFTLWRQRLFRDGGMARLEEYWLEQFGGNLPLLDMPLDFPRPPVRGSAGDRRIFHVPAVVTAAVKDLAAGAGTTAYTVLLAVYNILLSRYSGLEDIIVGVPVAGRNHADVQNIIGMFVNTLPIRNYPAADKTFAGFLQEVKEASLGAYEHQDYPLEELLERLAIPRDTSRNPLFDVLFVSENVDRPVPHAEGLEFTPYEYENPTAHMDLVMLTLEREDDIEMVLEFATDLFKPSTIDIMSGRYLEILEQVVENPGILLRDINITLEFSEAEVQESVDDYVGFDF